jgi:hypothetical protein
VGEGKKQAEAYYPVLRKFAKYLEALLKEINLDYFFTLVDDDGEVAAYDETALQAARARGAVIITLTPAEAKSYFPNRSRSFCLADATPTELKRCCEVAIETARAFDGTLPC